MSRFLSTIAAGVLPLPAGCQPGVDVAAATSDLLKTDQTWATLAAPYFVDT